MRSERGGLLTKIIIAIVILGIAAFEGGAVVVARVQVDGIAIRAAQEAAGVYDATHSTSKALAQAEQIARISGAELIAFEVQPDRVTVTVRKRARTLFIQHIGPLRRRLFAEATQEARIP